MEKLSIGMMVIGVMLIVCPIIYLSFYVHYLFGAFILGIIITVIGKRIYDMEDSDCTEDIEDYYYDDMD